MSDASEGELVAHYERTDSTTDEWHYDEIIAIAAEDASFRSGLRAAAAVCRAQGRDRSKPPCPSHMAAIYIERLANGEMP